MSKDKEKRGRRSCWKQYKNTCIFCEKDTGLVHEFRSLDADRKVRRMTTDLQDISLLTRIESGDLTALDAKTI